MVGTTISQAIPVVISPLLTRIYTPEDFGTFGLFTALTAILGVFATGKYELAIMLPKRDEDAVNIVALSIFLSLIVSFFLLILISFFNHSITSIIGNTHISLWLYFVPISVLFTGAYQSLNYWSNRKGQYSRLSINRVAQSGTAGIANLVMGWSGFTNAGLIMGTILGQGAATFILGKKVYKEDRNTINKINRTKIIDLSRRYIEFPKNTIFSSFTNTFYNNGRYLILGLVFTQNILGQFLLSFRALQMPVSIISTSIADVLFQKTSLWYNLDLPKKSIFKKLYKILLILMAIALFPALTLFFYGESLFSFVFGDKWALAGHFTSLLSLSLFFQFSFAPFCRVFYVLEKQSLYLLWEVVRLIVVFAPVLIMGSMGYNYSNIVLVMSVNISISYILLFILLKRVLK